MIREDRRKQKKRKKAVMILCGIFLFIAAAIVIIFQVFMVKKVVVEGNELYSNEQIQKIALSDEYSWNSLYVLLKPKFVKQEQIPFIDTMEITLENPHTVHITVYEKGMIGYFYIASIDQNAYFDKDGFVVETSSDIIESVPRVNGIECEKVVLYEKLPIKNEGVLRTLLSVTQAVKKYEIEPLSISFDAGSEITLSYDSVNVLLGTEESLTEKVMRIAVILPQLEGKSGTLHVENWSETTTDIIFKEEEVSPAQ